MADEVTSKEERLFIAPASLTQARAEAILSSKGSEDVSHLLLQFSEKELKKRVFGQGRDYLPNRQVDWAVCVDFSADVVLQKSVIQSVFDVDWVNNNDEPTLFGFSPEIKRWTFVNAGGSPETYSRLQIAWKLFSPNKEEPIPKEQFERYRTAVEQVACRLNAINVKSEISPDDAEKRSAKLIKLVSCCDKYVIVVLKAPDGRYFEGKAIWNVMLCLGLRWGDMDIFHWENPGVPGDDHLFSTWTSTSPGYFLPEEIAADRVKTEDLIFGFSIPRTSQPERIFDSLLRAAEYVRTRLGGELLNNQGARFSEPAARSEIHWVIQMLKDAGFEPGGDDTLYLI